MLSPHPSSSGSRRSAEEDLRLSDVWWTIATGRRWVIGVPLVTVLIALAYVTLSDPQWESSAVVQMGQVGQAEVGKATATVETPPRAIERMKTPTFQNDVLASIGISTADDNAKARLYRRSLRLRQPPGTDLIELRIRAYSLDEARHLAEATVEQLRKSHDKLALPSIDSLRKQLDDVIRQLERAQKERESLVSQVAAGHEVDARNRFAESALLGQMITRRDEELRQLHERRLMLEERLGPAGTYPTSLIEDAYVGKRPVFPRPVLTVVLAAVGGLLAGIVIVLSVGSRRASRASESEP